MMRLVLACLLLCAFGCGKKKELPKPSSDDFESLSGKGLPAWDYVQTKSDLEHLEFFKNNYEKLKEALKAPTAQLKIPKVVHYIWLGPKQFPRESVENVRSWMAKHPDWTFKFWTDRERPLPCPGMQEVLIQDFTFSKLAGCYAKGDNYGEKSDVLRLEILCQEGGIYVDHDVKCFKSFDLLNKSYDLYCGIDMPYKSSLPSCIFPTNNLIGARAHHPVIEQCMEDLLTQWDRVQEAYPGADADSVLNRVLHRTFWLFGEAIMKRGNQAGTQDIVFPAYYFDAPQDALALFARHQYSGTWHNPETAFEKLVRERLMYLSKKSNKILLFSSIMSGLNLFALIFLFLFLRAQRQRSGR